MDLLTLLFRLPLMPLRGFVRLAGTLHDQAERELRDPASVRRQLEEAQEARVSGEMSDEEVAYVEGQAVARLLSSPATTPGGTTARRKGTDRNG
jgi:hypothetical protein